MTFVLVRKHSLYLLCDCSHRVTNIKGSMAKKTPKYVIEREFKGAGELSSSELKGISKKSCDVLEELGTKVQWVESYVTNNKIYCVFTYSLSDASMEDAPNKTVSMRRVSKLSLDKSIPDDTTIINFCHLLERHYLG